MPPSPPPPPASQSPPPITSTPPPDILQPPELSPPNPPPPSSSTTSAPQRTLRIGTRASALALAQVSIFTSLLSTLHPTLPTTVVPISVAGDRDKTTDLHTLAQTGKSLWTEELEVLLLKGEIDCIVHSLKDVPTKVVEGCCVKVVGERGERRDCVVFPRRPSPDTEADTQEDGTAAAAAVNGHPPPPAAAAAQEGGGQSAPATTPTTATAPPNNYTSIPSADEPSPTKKRKISPSPSSTLPAAAPQTLSSLPPSSVVGTSSIRRSAMIRRRYPHLRIQDVRGNVGTRLRKLDDPAYGFDCLILAGAGIERLGLGNRVGEWLGPDTDPAIDGGEGKGEEGGDTEKEEAMMLHAVGQGAIGLEIREGDDWLHGLLGGTDGNKGVVVNRASWECQAERSLLRTLEGGCSVPVGVFCSWELPPLPSSSPQPALTQLSATGAEPDGSNEARVSEADSISTTPAMQPGILHMLASVTSVDGTECVAASRKQWVGSDEEADEAGWELARVLVERGAEKILKEIGLNRGMVERGDGA